MTCASSRVLAAEVIGLARAEAELAKQTPDPDERLFVPRTASPWCRFGPGTTECINGSACLNPNHVEDKDPWSDNVWIKRDRWKRYLLPHPETGVEQAWTRVTTAAKTQDDKYNLELRDQRHIAYGIGLRDDLRDLAASADGPDDKGTLDDVCKQAKSAAAADKKANIGTALPGFTQKVDRGDRTVRVPKVHQARIDRYKAAIARYGIEPIADLIECVIVVPDLGLAGTADRFVFRRRHGLKVSPDPIVFDVKTGSLDWGRVAMAQQLAAYAHATHRWTEDGWVELPPINKDYGYVLHLPADSDDEPTLKRVDIATGYDLLLTSLKVRKTRSSKGKDLFEDVNVDEVIDASPSPAPTTEAELRERVQQIVAAGFADELLSMWRDDVPTLSEGGLSDAQVAEAHEWCAEVEMGHGL